MSREVGWKRGALTEKCNNDGLLMLQARRSNPNPALLLLKQRVDRWVNQRFQGEPQKRLRSQILRVYGVPPR